MEEISSKKLESSKLLCGFHKFLKCIVHIVKHELARIDGSEQQPCIVKHELARIDGSWIFVLFNLTP